MLITSLKEIEPKIEKWRINISSKRQIKIPAKFFNFLMPKNLDKELDCIYANDMLILTPIEQNNSAFDEEILADLIQQGYSGKKLLTEFKKISHKIRPAVEKFIEEADIVAQTISSKYFDPTSKLFDTEKQEDS